VIILVIERSKGSPNRHLEVQVCIFSDSEPCGLLPSTLLTFAVQGASVFPLIRVSFGPCQLADRAFGAQRISGGRAVRRFAPPSAAGSASRCHLSCLMHMS